MVERLLLHGIHGEPRRASIPELDETPAAVLTEVTKAGLPVAEAAGARAQGAEELPVGLGPPPAGLMQGFRKHGRRA
jgi:hypothetical protein